jgi:hypothetical protein
MVKYWWSNIDGQIYDSKDLVSSVHTSLRSVFTQNIMMINTPTALYSRTRFFAGPFSVDSMLVVITESDIRDSRRLSSTETDFVAMLVVMGSMLVVMGSMLVVMGSMLLVMDSMLLVITESGITDSWLLSSTETDFVAMSEAEATVLRSIMVMTELSVAMAESMMVLRGSMPVVMGATGLAMISLSVLETTTAGFSGWEVSIPGEGARDMFTGM